MVGGIGAAAVIVGVVTLALSRAFVADVAQLGGVATALAATVAAVLVWRSRAREADVAVTTAQMSQLGPLLQGYDALLGQLRTEVTGLRTDLVQARVDIAAARSETAACEVRSAEQAGELAVLRREVEVVRRQMGEAMEAGRDGLRTRWDDPPPPPQQSRTRGGDPPKPPAWP